MTGPFEPGLRQSGGGAVESLRPGAWRLSLPAGPAKAYRWAQLDDYLGLPRSRLCWRPPVRLSLRARVSAAGIPGTWGFGFWNDPFSASIGLGGMSRRLPALPDAAWFFYASPPNYLSFRDDLPADGFLAAVFRATKLPAVLLPLGALTLPLLALPPAARLLRRLARRGIAESAARLEVDPTAWHAYRLEWRADSAAFFIDDELLRLAPTAPRGPLGFVLWIDNQFAAFPPGGKVRFGSLPAQEPVWLEVESLQIG